MGGQDHLDSTPSGRGAGGPGGGPGDGPEKLRRERGDSDTLRPNASGRPTGQVTRTSGGRLAHPRLPPPCGCGRGPFPPRVRAARLRGPSGPARGRGGLSRPCDSDAGRPPRRHAMLWYSQVTAALEVDSAGGGGGVRSTPYSNAPPPRRPAEPNRSAWKAAVGGGGGIPTRISAVRRYYL